MQWLLGSSGRNSNTQEKQNDDPGNFHHPQQHDEYEEEQEQDHYQGQCDEDSDDQDGSGRMAGPPPLGPPPTALSSTTPATTQPRNVLDLTRPQRPIDPVFRSGVEYATFPKASSMSSTTSSHYRHQDHTATPSINVFIPSAPATQNEEEGEQEEVVVAQIEEQEEQVHVQDEDFIANHYDADDNNGYEEEGEAPETEQELYADRPVEREYDDALYHGEQPVDCAWEQQYDHCQEEDVRNFPQAYENDADEIQGGHEGCGDHLNDHDHPVQQYDEGFVNDDEFEGHNANDGENVVEGDRQLLACVENGQDDPNSSENKHITVAAVDSASSFATPSHKPAKPSRFVFLSDQKRLPTDLKRLKERTWKRRRELRARMHGLDCQAAQLMSHLADEQMDFHLAIHDFFKRTVQRPLISSMERITIDRDSSSNPMVLQSLERRVGEIDVAMTRHIHETMCHSKREQLESLHDGLHQGIVTELRIENSKYDKVERSIVRRFEQVAGNLASDFESEAAKRRGETELLRRKVELTAKVEATERLQTKLNMIQALRDQLRKERAERLRSDRKIQTEINESKVRIERAILAALETEL